MSREECYEGIVLKVNQDQRDALADFYRSIEQRAFRMARFETRNPTEAMDLVQEAMEALMRRYAHRPSDEWRPLFHRILQNKIKDWHRRNVMFSSLFRSAKQEDNEEELISSQAITKSETPEDIVESDITFKNLQKVMQTLSFRQRQAFLLRIWEGYSVNETAQIMRCSDGSVKTHLSRAMSVLKKQLQEP